MEYGILQTRSVFRNFTKNVANTEESRVLRPCSPFFGTNNLVPVPVMGMQDSRVRPEKDLKYPRGQQQALVKIRVFIRDEAILLSSRA